MNQAGETFAKEVTLQAFRTRQVLLLFLVLQALLMFLVAPSASGGAVFLALLSGLAWRLRRCRSVDDARRALGLRLTGRLAVTAASVLLDGEVLFARSQVRSGLLHIRGSDADVVISLDRSVRYTVSLPSEEDARELARALGTDASGRTADFLVWTRRARAFKLALFGGVVAMTPLLPFLMARDLLVGLAACLVPIPLLFLAIPLVSSTIRIGTDGVEHRWLGRRRFIAYRDVREVKDQGSSVVLELCEGERVVWHVRELGSDPHVAHREGESLVVSRLREAMEAHRRGVADDGVEWLTRGERSVEEWVADLRSMGAGGRRTYRASPPSREALFRIALDPAANEDVRAGAAIALGSSLDDSARERLRVAARVTVAPKLRVVLERQAEGSLDEDEAALVLTSRRLGAT